MLFRSARAAAAWTRDTISSTTHEWLSAQPVTRVVDGFSLVHGSPRDPLREYVTTPDIARANLDVLGTSYGLHGHTHIPVAFVEVDRRITVVKPGDATTIPLSGDRALLNPGSVGQPRDGDPRAAYAILDPEAGLASWYRIAYDVTAVQAAMRLLRLPPRLAARLAYGM